MKKRQLQLIAMLMATDKSFKYESCSDLKKKKKKLNRKKIRDTREQKLKTTLLITLCTGNMSIWEWELSSSSPQHNLTREIKKTGGGMITPIWELRDHTTTKLEV